MRYRGKVFNYPEFGVIKTNEFVTFKKDRHGKK
jgi:hypothetical protein